MAEGTGQTPEISDVTRLLDAGASFVRPGETVALVDGLPPGALCAESDDDVRALAVFVETIEHAGSPPCAGSGCQ